MTFDNFEKLFISIKVFFILALVIAALITKDQNFGINGTLEKSDNYSKFVNESLYYGIIGAIPFVYMTKMRNPKSDTDTLLKTFIIFFIMMILVNVVFQYSGVYGILYDKPTKINSKISLNEPDQKMDNFKNAIIYSVILISILIIIFYINLSLYKYLGC